MVLFRFKIPCSSAPKCNKAPPNVSSPNGRTSTALCAMENEVGAFGVSFACEMSLYIAVSLLDSRACYNLRLRDVAN